MNKFNLKYLVIAVVVISLLMVGGALIFSQLAFKTQKLPNPSGNANNPIAPDISTGGSGGGGSAQTVQPAKPALTPALIK